MAPHSLASQKVRVAISYPDREGDDEVLNSFRQLLRRLPFGLWLFFIGQCNAIDLEDTGLGSSLSDIVSNSSHISIIKSRVISHIPATFCWLAGWRQKQLFFGYRAGSLDRGQSTKPWHVTEIRKADKVF